MEYFLINDNMDLDKKPEIDIYNLFDNDNDNIKCKFCNNNIKINKKFISYPQILIIIIEQNNISNLKFKYTEELDIHKYADASISPKESNYQLKSIFIQRNKTSGIVYSKSPLDNLWYMYDTYDSSILQKKCNSKEIPHILIYENS